jgi:hypothetical protein
VLALCSKLDEKEATMRFRMLCSLALLVVVPFVPLQAQGLFVPRAGNLAPIYRLYQPQLINHLYTNSLTEAQNAQFAGYSTIGVEFFVNPSPAPGLVPLYRFLLPNGTHYLSTSRRAGLRMGARNEGILGYISSVPRGGLVALNEWYLPQGDRFFYTTDPNGEIAPQTGWQYSGVIGYVVPGR